MNRQQRRHPGGRPSDSRRVRVVPVRRSVLDHRTLARVLLAILAQDVTTDVAANDSATPKQTTTPIENSKPQIPVEGEK